MDRPAGGGPLGFAVPYTACVHSLAAFAVLVALVVAGCSTAETAEPEPSTTTTTVSPVTTAPAVISSGIVTVGDDSYDLDVTCIAPGAGEVLAVGIGETAEGDLVKAYVQAFLGSPYIGLEIGETLLESSFAGSLDLYLQNDQIRASAIRFVTDLDLATGEGRFVGVGTIDITCDAYDEELPDTSFG